MTYARIKIDENELFVVRIVGLSAALSDRSAILSRSQVDLRRIHCFDLGGDFRRIWDEAGRFPKFLNLLQQTRHLSLRHPCAKPCHLFSSTVLNLSSFRSQRC